MPQQKTLNMAEVLIDPKVVAGRAALLGSQQVFLTIEHPRHGTITALFMPGTATYIATEFIDAVNKLGGPF